MNVFDDHAILHLSNGRRLVGRVESMEARKMSGFLALIVLDHQGEESVGVFVNHQFICGVVPCDFETAKWAATKNPLDVQTKLAGWMQVHNAST